ncbi:hypothetical protein [Actinoplanes subtropicus]|uniref:hypothetical protein n=1 Tax=Actinoplanes subtropicus TaxID=543632 RepID=UPI000AF5FDD4|nr:hypothetical protein [Actinoplanes subtropicus]
MAALILHGAEAVNNLTLRGWAEAHHLSPAARLLAAGVVVASVVGRVSLSSMPSVPPVRLGTIALLATFLSGAIPEVSYLFIALAAAMLLAALTSQTTAARWWALLPGTMLLASPFRPHRPADQTWLVLSQLFLLAGALAAVRPRPGYLVKVK